MRYLNEFPNLLSVFVASDAVDGIEVDPDSVGRKEVPSLLVDMFLFAESMLKERGSATLGAVLGPLIAEKIGTPLRDITVAEAAYWAIPDPVNDALKTVLGLAWMDLRQLVNDWEEGELFS